MTKAQQRFMAAFKRLGGVPSVADVARNMKPPVSRQRAHVLFRQLIDAGFIKIKATVRDEK